MGTERQTRTRGCYWISFYLALLLLLGKRAQAEIRYSISEEVREGTVVGNVAKDLGLDITSLNDRRFRVVSESKDAFFEVNQDNGALRVHKKIDREYLCQGSGACLIELKVIVENPLEIHYVVVEITDVNDHSPSFPEKDQKFEIAEHTLPGKRFQLHTANDPDSGINSIRTYTLTLNEYFEVDIRQKNSALGTIVTKVQATDLDDGTNGDVEYVFGGDNNSKVLQLFSLDKETGEIRVNGQIDYETADVFKLDVQASDKEAFAASDVKSAAKVDEEDNVTFYLMITLGSVSVLFIISIIVLIAMQCSKTTDYTSKYLQDTNYDGTLCHSIQYRSGDKRYMLVGPRMSIGSTIVPGSHANTLVLPDRRQASGEDANFEVNQNNGVLYVHNHIDREELCQGRGACLMELKIIVENPLEIHYVVVEITDVNDHSPSFPENEQTFEIAEHTSPGRRFQLHTARDPDTGINSIRTYTLTLDRYTGQIRTLRLFTETDEAEHKLIILVKDNGNVSLSATATVIVKLVEPKEAFAASDVKSAAKVDEEDNVTFYLMITLGSVSVLFIISIIVLIAMQCSKTTDYTSKYLQDTNYDGTLCHSIQYRSGDKRYMLVGPRMSIGSTIVPGSHANTLVLPDRRQASGEKVKCYKTKAMTLLVIAVHGAEIQKNLTHVRPKSNTAEETCLDRYTGQIRTLRLFTETDEAEHKLIILVKDNGNVSLSATATVIVKLVEPKEAFAASDVKSAAKVDEEDNVTFYLMITLGSVSVLFIISIIVLIAMQCSKTTDYTSKYLQDTNYDGTLCHSIQYRSGDKRYMLVGPRMSIGSTIVPGSHANTLVLPDRRQTSGEIIMELKGLGGSREQWRWIAFIVVFIFLWSRVSAQIRYSVAEEVKEGTVVGNIAKDLGLEKNTLKARGYRIVEGSTESFFHVNQNDGILYVDRTVDREKVCERTSVCLINLKTVLENPLEIHYVTVEVLDVNDHSPSFATKESHLEISESALPGLRLQLQAAHDPDGGQFSVQEYKLSPNDHFRLECSKTTDYTSKYLQDTNYDGTLCHSIQYRSGDKRYMLVGPRMSIGSTIVPGSHANTLVLPDRRQASGEDNMFAVVTKAQLDREKQSRYDITIVAKDVGEPALTSEKTISISVSDTNDNSPEFSCSKTTDYTSKYLQDTNYDGTLCHSIQYRSGDKRYMLVGPRMSIGSTIVPGSHANTLVLPDRRQASGECSKTTDYTSKYLQDTNYDGTLCHSIQYRSGDKRYMLVGPRMSIGSTIVPGSHANTLVLPDRRQASGEIRYSISEEGKTGTVVGDAAKDLGLDKNTLKDRNFRIASGSTEPLFLVNQNDGILYVKRKVDREEVCGRSSTCLINLKTVLENPLEIHYVAVDVIDVNDHSPSFSEKETNLEISESAVTGARFQLQAARDADSGQFSIQQYKLSHNDHFRIEVKDRGEDLTKATLDRENQAQYDVRISCKDAGEPALSSEITIRVAVSDVNDNSPEFSQSPYTFYVIENNSAGSSVFSVSAFDRDENDNALISYQILRYGVDDNTRASFIDINRNNGDIIALKKAFAASDVKSAAKVDEEDNVTFYLMITLGSVSVLFIISIIVLIAMQCSKTTDYTSKYLQDTNYDGTLCHSIQYRSGDKRYMLVGPRMSIGSTIVPGSHANTLVLPDRRQASGECSKTTDYTSKYLQDTNYDGTLCHSIQYRSGDKRYITLKDRRYRIVSSNADHLFHVNENDGILYVSRKIDREEVCAQSSTCLINLKTVLENPLEVHYVGVEVLDINDHSPSFPEKETTLEISESVLPGARIQLKASRDRDSGHFSVQQYKLSQNDHFRLEVKDKEDEAFAASDVKSAAKVDEEDNVTFYLMITLGSVSVLFIISIIVLIAMQCSKTTDYTSKYLQDTNYDGTLCHSIQYRSGDKRYMLVGPRMSIGSTIVPGSHANTLVLPDRRQTSGEVRHIQTTILSPK
ncbi:hypothetical protein PAMP_023706 [Pampus punctatissimus]